MKLLSALLYTSLALGANIGHADPAAIEALRDGDMRKLQIASTPADLPSTPFQDETGADMTLADLKGQVTLVNFWATWCAPCRKEMPHLAELQAELGGDDFRVVTIATGRNSPDGITRFFDEIGVDSLPRYTDPRQALARDLGIVGLPVTLVLNRDGQEVGRLLGDADWSSDSAKAIVSALISE